MVFAEVRFIQHMVQSESKLLLSHRARYGGHHHCNDLVRLNTQPPQALLSLNENSITKNSMLATLLNRHYCRHLVQPTPACYVRCRCALSQLHSLKMTVQQICTTDWDEMHARELVQGEHGKQSSTTHTFAHLSSSVGGKDPFCGTSQSPAYSLILSHGSGVGLRQPINSNPGTLDGQSVNLNVLVRQSHPHNQRASHPL